MPLLQGQPFKLIKPPDIIPGDVEISTIKHTGEIFLNKSDYEDRLALYSQTIWTCQCTGRSGLTHQEAWASEAVVRNNAKMAIVSALHKPLLMLVHHSLSPLDQLVDASSILCYSQFHIGEELMLLHPKPTKVCVVKVSDNDKHLSPIKKSDTISNGLSDEGRGIPVVNGSSNGVSEGSSIDNSPGKENQSKVMVMQREDPGNRREMLPKLYSVLCLDNQNIIDDVPASYLQRTYKVPSKDQLRLFIRSCALRLRGSTCSPWVVAEDLLQQYNIVNKLPSLFLSSPRLNQAAKRKAVTPSSEPAKRPKPDKPKEEKFSQNYLKLPEKAIHHQTQNLKYSPTAPGNYYCKETNSTPKLSYVASSPTKISPKEMSSMLVTPVKSASSSNYFIKKQSSGGKPMSKLTLAKQKSTGSATGQVVKKRGRPRLSEEEKARNKKLREATLFDLASKNQTGTKLLKIKTTSDSNSTPTSPFKTQVKKINNSDALMKLPMMRRLVHEHKTIKGVTGQYRRMAYTMDYVLNKLNPEQIDLIPDEILRNDLIARQKKVKDKEVLNTMTPEERKEHMRNRARLVALERWKERKLKNLKIEDQTLKNLKPLPELVLVKTPEGVPNSLFGDIAMITDFIKCFRELLLGEERFHISSNHLMEALCAGPVGYKVIVDIMCCLLPTIIHDDISKHCKELGVPISVIPVNYQTAPELARLCLKKQEIEESDSQYSDDGEDLGREENELSDELLGKLESLEFWKLNSIEIISVVKALVHKALGTAALSVYVAEMEERVSQALKERRRFLREIRHEKTAEQKKKKLQKTSDKTCQPKRSRGRPRKSETTLKQFYEHMKHMEEEAKKPVCSAVLQRRKSVENKKSEKAFMDQLEKEKQKQFEEDLKRRTIERKYEDIVIKRDNLLRRQPIGYDRFHNRYWIFHTTTPGLYLEKGFVGDYTDYQYMLDEGVWVNPLDREVIKKEPYDSDSDDNKPLSAIASPIKVKNYNKPLSELVPEATIATSTTVEDDNNPLSELVPESAVATSIKVKEVNTPISELVPAAAITTSTTVKDDNKPLSELVSGAAIATSIKVENANTYLSELVPSATVLTSIKVEDNTPLSELAHGEDNLPLATFVSSTNEPKSEDEDNQPLATIATTPNKLNCTPSKRKNSAGGEDDVSIAKNKFKQRQKENENKPLSSIKSKLTLSPMRMSTRGRPPKEAYVLVDEDTQTFPSVGENLWFYYPSMDAIKSLVMALTEEGQRESQLAASINLNKDRLQYHYTLKPDPLKMVADASERLVESLKEDILQIERELIEGWLGGISNFDEWEAKVREATNTHMLGELLIDAQKHMQLKYLKGIMSPERKQLEEDSTGQIDYDEVDSVGAEKWRDEVRGCKTYSRLHVLVGIFDNCIRWEKSMATRKCKVCRSKSKENPLAQCDKCETSYHWYCLRPPLKEDPGDSWLCPACVPKKTRRQEIIIEEFVDMDDPEEKNDPTFILDTDEASSRRLRKMTVVQSKKKKLASANSAADVLKEEHKCKICQGRIGLIFCSKCNDGYHSECHEPPLQSRARKDWVCADCSKKTGKAVVTSEALTEEKKKEKKPFYNIMDRVFNKETRHSDTVIQRDIQGRFIKGRRPRSNENDDEKGDIFPSEESVTQATVKFGRVVRDAKAKAIESITGDDDKASRRSRRTKGRGRKSYKYESEEDTDDSLSESEEENVIVERVIEEEEKDEVEILQQDDGLEVEIVEEKPKKILAQKNNEVIEKIEQIKSSSSESDSGSDSDEDSDDSDSNDEEGAESNEEEEVKPAMARITNLEDTSEEEDGSSSEDDSESDSQSEAESD